MRRAEDMIRWFKLTREVNRTGYTDYKIKSLFKIIESNLTPGEEVKIVFPIVEGLVSPFFYKFWNFWGTISAIAITNKGIIISNISGVIIKIKKAKTIKLDYLNDISKQDRIFFTTINIDTVKETIDLTIRKRDANKLYTLIRHVVLEENKIEDETNILGNNNVNRETEKTEKKEAKQNEEQENSNYDVDNEI